MQQATIPAAGSRKALAKWMGEVDGHKSFETSARAVNTQQDRWFTGRRRAVTRATKRPPASFVASPILARASRGNTPISSQRRELSRSLTGSTSPVSLHVAFRLQTWTYPPPAAADQAAGAILSGPRSDQQGRLSVRATLPIVSLPCPAATDCGRCKQPKPSASDEHACRDG
jgi:hypothetical protein